MRLNYAWVHAVFVRVRVHVHVFARGGGWQTGRRQAGARCSACVLFTWGSRCGCPRISLLATHTLTLLGVCCRLSCCACRVEG